MPSILPGYEYDIFISYRQNDNKRDKWVTNFVDALKEELEATLKNPVTIYFDENPHDGLLESHQVGASLEKKLKCLIFIPIVSQTYCDTECFAWEHEFLPFNKMAHEDELGMNITLASGNVASRVLPIKIHDLDSDDEQTFEKELGGIMRSIDFIYKEAGVNRPLKPTDDRNLNQEKLDYHNQINKVANALKEIGTSLVNSTSVKNIEPATDSITTSGSKPTKKEKSPISLKLIFGVLFIPVVLAAAYFLYTNYYNQRITSGELDKSIAVLPFRNDSNDPANIYFCNGLMEDIINQLSQIPDMRVPSATSMLYYRDNPKSYEEIIAELNVSYLLEASVRKTADKALMNITLIDAAKNEQIWSERLEMDLSVKDLFDVQFDVANAVANKMRIALESSKTEIPTSSYDAYDKYTKARDLMKFWDLDKNRIAINILLEAITLDDKFLNAYVFLGQAYGQRAELSDGGYWVDSARHYSTIAYGMDKKDAGAVNALGYAYVLEGMTRKGLEFYLESQKLNPNTAYNYAGWCYFQLGEFDKAIEMASRNISLDPNNSIYYVDMSDATNAIGLFEYSIYYGDKGLEINADHPFIHDKLKEMEYFKGNYMKALEHLQLIVNISNSPKDEALKGIIYYKMGNLEQASHYLNADYRSLINEDSGDENSKIELYTLLQYRALVDIKLGEEIKGKQALQKLILTIEANLATNRPEKYLLLAGCHATLGETETSLEYLNKAAAMGYKSYNDIINNSLLDILHGNDDYERLVTKIKSRNDKMRETVLENDFLTKL